MADGSSPQVTDGFKNVVAGLAAGNAKVAAGHYTTGTNIAEADAAFRASTWYGKILTIPADDAVREWRAWQGDNDQIEALEREEKRLGYRLRIRDALTNARHQGGCVIIPGGLPGNPATPLNLDRITTGSLQFLHVLGPEEITPGQIVRNPLSPDFGRPEYWEIRGEGSQLRMHPSRVVLVNGRRVPGSTLRSGTVWGDSIWLHLADAIMAADAGAAVISALMHEAKIDIVKIPGMTEMMASASGEQAVMRRWTLAAQMKSIANVMLLDGGPLTGDGSRSEEWDQKQVTWSGLPDVQGTLLQIMAGAADIPMTRLTGEQQTGLSGADEGSTRHYYDMIGARQSLDIEPAIAPLDEMLIRSALGSRPDDLWYAWRPLWKATAKELAEIDKLEAEAASLYARDALVPTEALEAAVQNRMIESGRWPGLEAALDDVALGPDDDGGDDGDGDGADDAPPDQ